MKKVLCLLLTMVILLAMVTPVMAASEATVKMYAADGRTTDVPQSKVDAYRKVGWYNGPIITIYAADGRTKKIGANDKAAYLKVGWYDSPLITVYAADGRTKKIPSSQKDAYLKVGWYDSPLITMYAADGRTKKIPSSQKEAYKKVGWYYGPITTLYSTDGRTKKIGANDKAAYLKVGWFETKPVKMYSPDGRTKFVESYDVEKNKKVGWYTEAVRMMYNSKGETKIVKQKDIEANKKNGWVLEVVSVNGSTYDKNYKALRSFVDKNGGVIINSSANINASIMNLFEDDISVSVDIYDKDSGERNFSFHLFLNEKSVPQVTATFYYGQDKKKIYARCPWNKEYEIIKTDFPTYSNEDYKGRIMNLAFKSFDLFLQNDTPYKLADFGINYEK